MPKYRILLNQYGMDQSKTEYENFNNEGYGTWSSCKLDRVKLFNFLDNNNLYIDKYCMIRNRDSGTLYGRMYEIIEVANVG